MTWSVILSWIVGFQALLHWLSFHPCGYMLFFTDFCNIGKATYIKKQNNLIASLKYFWTVNAGDKVHFGPCIHVRIYLLPCFYELVSTSCTCCEVYRYCYSYFSIFLFPLIPPFLWFFHSVMFLCLVIYHVILPLHRPCQPVLWAGPELLVLSLLSRHSPVLPWCWLRTLAANSKSKCHRDVSSGWLLRPGCQLCWILSHVAILLVRGVTLQQVGSCPATRGQPGTLSLYRQHTEGSQVSSMLFLRQKIQTYPCDHSKRRQVYGFLLQGIVCWVC